MLHLERLVLSATPSAVAAREGCAVMPDGAGSVRALWSSLTFFCDETRGQRGQGSQTDAVVIVQDALSTRYGAASDACTYAPGQGD